APSCRNSSATTSRSPSGAAGDSSGTAGDAGGLAPVACSSVSSLPARGYTLRWHSGHFRGRRGAGAIGLAQYGQGLLAAGIGTSCRQDKDQPPARPARAAAAPPASWQLTSCPSALKPSSAC